MPEIDQNELIAHVEWNENIHIDENQSRVSQLFASIDNQVQEHTAYVGQQQFLLNRDREMSVSESELYLRRRNQPESLLCKNRWKNGSKRITRWQ